MSKSSNFRKQLSGKKAKSFREFSGSFDDFSNKSEKCEPQNSLRTRKTRRSHEPRKVREKRLSKKLAAENNSRSRGADQRAAEIRASLIEAKEISRNDRGDQRRVNSNIRPTISEMVREATAGGVIFRISEHGELEILLVADHFNRWTIPKGHIEEGETAQETAIREIGEEAGLHELEPICWLGKIHFRYRRESTLVLMSTQIYLFRALGDTNKFQKEDWMNDIRWFRFDEAVEMIAYEDIAKLILLARNRLSSRGDIN